METPMTVGRYSLLAVLAVVLLSGVSGYDLGEDVPICWRTNMTTGERVQLPACPTGMSVEITSTLPEKMRALEVYPVAYELNMPTDGSVVVHGSTLPSGAVVEVPHANIHSCLSNVGFCTPFVANSPGLSTHSKALTGSFTAGKVEFVSEVTLDVGVYNLISHGRVFTDGGAIKYDMAALVRATIFPPENEVVLDQGVKDAMLAAVILSVAIGTSMLVSIGIWRSHVVMRFSQISFMVCMAISSIASSVGTLTLGYLDISDSICNLRSWATYLPFTVLLSGLLAKTLRVYFLMFKSKQMKKVKFSSKQAGLVAVGFVLPMLALLAGQMLANPPTVAKEFQPGDEINFSYVCSAPDGDAWTIAMVGYVITLLIVGALLGRSTSTFTVLFNESKSIALAVQNLFLLGAILMPVQYASGSNPNSLYMVRSMGLLAAVNSALLALMLPKLRLIQSGVKFGNIGKRGGVNSTATTSVMATSQRESSTHLVGSAPSSPNGSSTDLNSAVKPWTLKKQKCTVRNGSLPRKVITMLDSLAATSGKVANNQKAGMALDLDELLKLAQACSALGETLAAVKDKQSGAMNDAGTRPLAAASAPNATKVDKTTVPEPTNI